MILKMTKKERILITVFMVFSCLSATLQAEDGTYSIGGTAGWKGLAAADNIAWTRGEEGCDAWMIAERELKVTRDTDVLLNFNGRQFYDEAGHYTVTAARTDAVVLVDHHGDHGNSVLFRGNGGLTLKASPEALFGTSGLTGSFTVGFWMNPSVVDSGEQILGWHSSRNLANYSLYQMIVAGFENNHLVWHFTNVFDTYTEDNKSLEIKGKSVLIPGSWSYHQLVYNAENGLLEYLVNGRIEDMRFITDTGRESGTVYPARLGVVADLELCPSYTGYLDDFSIERKAVPTDELQDSLFDRYAAEGGTFMTGIFTISDNGVKINRIHVNETVPELSDTRYYLRWDTQPYGWTDEDPAWHEFSSDEILSRYQTGYNLYFQIKGMLFTDGTASYTPVISGFDISYSSRELPFAPYNLTAVAGNGTVTLSWKASPTDTMGEGSVGGYLVYYGERPGEYLGTAAFEGSSPIRCGNTASVTLHGLENGKLYYFAVCAYSGDTPVVTGPLSSEVYARPGSRKK